MYLGMDGGGTKTAFVLVDRDGVIRATQQGGGAYYLETGMDALRALVNDGIAALLRSAGVTAAAIDYAFFGLPVHGEDAQTRILDELPAASLPRSRYTCGNDMVCGWAGSLAGADGINVVAGTGSICYGEHAGRKARSGGWGELFSDEGSAYWIARHGLTLFTRMSDGRAPRGALYDLLRERLGARGDLELTAWVQEQLDLGRSRFAALSRLVHAAAASGDEQAVHIFTSAAGELAQLVDATRRALAVPADLRFPVSYSGGVFGIGALVTEPFQRALQDSQARYRLQAPRFTPTIGAALYAAKLDGRPLTDAALNRLAAALPVAAVAADEG